jgi:hypothetical protein
MARASHEVKVRLTAEDRASKAFESAEKSAGKFAGFLKRNLVATLATVGVSALGMSKAIRSGFDSMLEAIKGATALKTALEKTNDATRENIVAFQAQADAIQSSTRFTADSITQTQAFLKQLGVSTGQLELATQASIDLAESFGLTLESAARNVGKTVGGFAGELGDLIPELKTLDAEALQAGKGIQLLADKFSGAAAAGAESLEGKLVRLNNELSDLGKNFVIGATGAGDFEDAIGRAVDGLAENQDAARELGRIIGSELVGTFNDLKDGVTESQRQIDLVRRAFGLVGEETIKDADLINRLTLRFAVHRQEQERLEKWTRQLNAAFKDQNSILEEQLDLTDRNNRVNSEANDRAQEVIATFKELGVTLESDVNAQIDKNIRKLEQVRIAYDQRLTQNGKLIVDAKALATAERLTAEENRKLTESLRDQNDVLDDSVDSFQSAGRGAEDYARSLDSAASSTRNLQRAEEEAAAARAVGLAAAQTLGGTIGGGGSKLFPNSAVANTAIRNGQLVFVGGQRFRN